MLLKNGYPLSFKQNQIRKFLNDKLRSSLIIILIINLAVIKDVFFSNFRTLDQRHFTQKKNSDHFFKKKLQNKI